MLGIFGNLFDLNHDGKLDSTERAMEFSLLQNIINSANSDNSLSDNDNSDNDLSDED